MSKVGTGNVIYELRRQIQKLTSDLDLLENPLSGMPELINSANLLRSNEILSEANSKKSEIIHAYQKYSTELESMLEAVFDIQKELKDILKIQTSLLTNQKGKKKSPPKKKSKK